MDKIKIEKKISMARAYLVMHHPFLGTIALHLRINDGTSIGCVSMGTDGKFLYYHPDFVKSLDIKELRGVIAHEIMHIVYQHVLGWRNGKDKQYPEIYEAACEYVVNEAVAEMFNLPLPGNPYLDKRFYGMYTEQVYAELIQEMLLQQKPKPQPGKGDNSGNGNNPGGLDKNRLIDQHGIGVPISQKEAEVLADSLKIIIAQAAHTARMAGKLQGGLQRIIDDVLEPKIPWKQVLAEFVTSMARDDYSWRQPNRRHIFRNIIMPSLKSETLEIAIAFDTSGSITPEELKEFWSEFKGILGVFPSYKIYLMACDAAVHSYQELDPWTDADMTGILKGGGGTDFRPVFQKLEEEDVRPHALVYMTDACGIFPDNTPEYPVLWIVKGNGEVPWGRRCSLDY